MPTPKPTPPSDLLNAYLAGADAARSAAPALPSEPPPIVPPPAPPGRPPLVWIAAGVLALACAGMAGALLAGRGEEPPPPVVAVAPVTPPAYTPMSRPEPMPAPDDPAPTPVAETVPLDDDGDEYEDEAATYPYATPGLPSGTWFVVLGGARGTPDARMIRAENELRGHEVNVRTIVSDDYPGLNPGLVVLVEGPTTQAVARQRLRLLKALVPDAYVKSGW